jgi:excisionase family DNA binding protein
MKTKTKELFDTVTKEKIFKVIQRYSKKRGFDESYAVSVDDKKYYIPSRTFHRLIQILADISEGKRTITTSSTGEITTGEAAKILGCSRVHVVNLTNKGIINFTKTGRHRRVLLKDIEEFKRSA